MIGQLFFIQHENCIEHIYLIGLNGRQSSLSHWQNEIFTIFFLNTFVYQF